MPFDGGEGGSAVVPPNLVRVNVPQVTAAALAADDQSYRYSDEDFQRRFPQLVEGREFNIGNAVDNLGGVQDPSINRALETAGLGPRDLGDTNYKQARSLGQPILAKEQRDRNYFQTLLSHNPRRQRGATGGDTINLNLANIGAQNAFNQQTYGTRIGAYNAGLLQDAQNNAAIFSALGSLGAAGIKGYGNYQPAGGGNSISSGASSAGGYFDPSYYSSGNAPIYYGG